jgi:hypothetical protein
MVSAEAGSVGADVHYGFLDAKFQQVQDALSHGKCADYIDQKHLLEVVYAPADSATVDKLPNSAGPCCTLCRQGQTWLGRWQLTAELHLSRSQECQHC